MRDFISKIPGLGTAKELSDTLISKVSETLDSGVGLLSATVQGIPFFGSTASSEHYDGARVDEKHYFLIPDAGSEKGFSLYVMRSLPAGVPPINDRPKQRLLHLPGHSALPMLRDLVISEARDKAASQTPQSNFVIDNLQSLVNEIDEVDGKVFNGVLLLGGLIALANPLAGAAIAMKAMVPSVGLILSKYGLKIASETATNIDVANRIKRAEKDVMRQFKQSNTVEVINPLLAQLARAQDGEFGLGDESSLDFQSGDLVLSDIDKVRLLELTREAIDNIAGPEANTASDSYLGLISKLIKGGA